MRARSSPRRRAVLAPPPVVLAAGALVLGIASAVLVAWVERLNGVMSLPAWIYRANPMTAACLALAGAALVLPRTTRPSASGTLRAVLGGVITVIATMKLAQLAMGQPRGVDLLLFPREVLAFKRSGMAPNTALALLLLGPSLALSAQRWRMATPAAQLLAAGTLTLATMGLIAYACGALSLVEPTGVSVMAAQTAVALVFAAFGVLWTRPHRALAGIVTNQTLGGVTARRLLPVVLLMHLGLGAIRVELARRGVFDETTRIAFHITALLIVTTTIVLILAEGLRAVSLRLGKREHALLQSAAELEVARDAANAAARVKADFIANMSHEIRTPLTAIVGYADRLAMRVDLDAAARREVLRVDTAAQALLAIVNDVLDFSKLEAGQVVIKRLPVDPAALVVEVVSLFEQQAAAKNLGVEFEARPNLPSCLLIDPDRVRQVLLNLIGNAVKFTEAGSVRVVVGYDAGAGRLQVDVEDSGPGVTAAQRDLLFRRFSQIDASATRRYGGTGLGLAICKGLVEAMQGEIGVRTREGGGSVFHVALPAPRGLGLASAAPVRDAVRLDGMRVLVVDDDEVNRELVHSILAPLGAEVVEAPGGREGVAAAAAPFDAILMDLRMPRLDGYAATAKIRSGAGPNRDAPIIAFSASLEPPGSSDGGDAAFSGFLQKPFAPGDLVAAMQDCLGLRTARSASRSA